MKSILNKYILILFAAAFMVTSCGEELAEINIDPDNPSTARPQEVLTAVLDYTAFVMDAQYNNEAFLWGQFWTWGTGVSLGDNARYIQEPRDANQAWARSYSNALADVKFLKKAENPAYSGIAKVMEAFIYQYLVDHFGDVPYSEAINGAIEDGSIVAPNFDDDAAIYPALVTTLDEALADLSGADDIGSEDLVFGGSIANWTKFANSLKLRILMRMSGVNDVSAQVAEVMANGEFLESIQAEVAFSGETGSENPMYAWEESGIGLFYKAATTVTEILDDTDDPRLFYFYKEAVNFPGEIRAGDQNQIALDFGAVNEDWSDPADVTYGAAVPTIFMSSWETWFLRAEAARKFNTGDDFVGAVETAIRENSAYLGVPAGDVETFLTSFNFGGASADVQDRLLAVQKWISMTGLQEAEGWIESRRFDTPSTPYFTGDGGVFQVPLQSALPGRTFPSRWLYAESEQNLNPNFPGQPTVTDKVFWDN